MATRALAITAALLAAGCSKDEPKKGLPAAESWSAPAPAASEAGQAGANPHGGMANPHAGMNDPHAGLNMNDPHAGLDMSDPHAGMAMGDPAMAGLQPPDPDRKIDPSKFLRGQITVAPEVAEAVKPGAILFLSVRPIEPVTGTVIGQPLAVERFEVGTGPIAFDLSGADSMVAGTVFEGDVEIYARVDGDGEATSKEPGDVEGSVRAKIPAKGLELVLDTLLR